jgi:hypothetical protein
MNMLFFRSEDDLNEWLTSRRATRGAVFSLPRLWALSRIWYSNRMSPDYQGRSTEQVLEIFKEAGLTSDFWQPAPT